MTMEAAAGKNPVNHVGKLHNIMTGRIAAALVADVLDVRSATCVLVSQIGRPIDDPQVAELRITFGRTTRVEDVRQEVSGIVRHQLARRVAEEQRERRGQKAAFAVGMMVS